MIRGLLGDTRRYVHNLLDTPAVILLYHRVTQLEKDPQLLSVTPENFYDHIRLLREKYALLGIGEFADLIAGKKKIPRKAVIVTFDDGYADNFLEALPILETLDSQALFYITTSNIDTPYELWWDNLERIFLEGAALPPVLEMGNSSRRFRWPTVSETDRQAAYQRCHPILKYTPPAERDEIIDNLLSAAGLVKEGRPTHRLMTRVELAKMGDSGSAVIGAHTHNHPVLSLLSYAEQSAEIGRSKGILESILNSKIEHFSYPYGMKKDTNSDSIRVCHESGFRMVCSNYYGQVHAWSDRMRLPRVLVRNWDKQTFELQLSKFFRY